ncbi:MAG: hypothetical protein AAGA18_00920 [Verrucomicrobiota bacterium]
MIILLMLFCIWVVSLIGFIGLALSAPEGYENEEGFHYQAGHEPKQLEHTTHLINQPIIR